MSRRCSPAAASLLRGLVGPAILCLGRSMSLCGAPAACAAGPADGNSSGDGGAGFSARLSPPWLRLPEVPGAEPHRANELLLLLPPPVPRGLALPQHHVVYFPGDVQNYHDVMSCHPENFQWERWSFENIATILARRFPGSFIWVVKCSRMHLHKFSCYDNFVASNMFGAPEHSADFGAFRHLHALLVNAFRLAQNILLSQKSMHGVSKEAKIAACKSQPQSVPATNGCTSTERDCECSSNSAGSFPVPAALGAASFTLIGFSKGCVVLNQLLYELKEAKRDKNTDAFLKIIKAIYWLDGGHSGGSNTWVTYPEVLKELAETGIEVHAHVTPYQVFDTMRSWIGREHEKFVQILEGLGVEINDQLHFADDAPSLENHFRVHEVF
ncbi:mitochondrial protein C2orf69 homolog [Melanerpes formicivorus]|uniref:mitochondrial protein C2orf69 homolog n=1 Tax=Melanerpes formicivorus TaxID=211600 RepID=UPI00358F56F1